MVCALGKKIAVQERACGATRTSANRVSRESVRPPDPYYTDPLNRQKGRNLFIECRLDTAGFREGRHWPPRCCSSDLAQEPGQ
jgi:hypothetical protein